VAPVSDFRLLFCPGTKYEAYLTFTVNAPAVKWTLVPDLLAINGVGVSCRVSTNAWAIALASQLVVASVPMVLTVYLNQGTIWAVELTPADKAAFPGLAALAAWVGGATLASDTTQSLASVGFDHSALDLAISKLSVRFDWAKPALQAVQVVTLLTLHALQLDVMVSASSGRPPPPHRPACKEARSRSPRNLNVSSTRPRSRSTWTGRSAR
jgi:hypothetical protein